jgi:predicted PurR-regulated permease PerM
MREILPAPFPPGVRQIASVPATLVVGAIVIGALYFARDVFVPLALAVLLSFVLAPMAGRVQKLRLGRVASVLLVVTVAFVAFFSLFGYVGTQVAQLAADLPAYQITIQEKIKALRGAGGDGAFERAGNVLQTLDDELNRHAPKTSASSLAAAGATPGGDVKPIPVEVHQPAPSTLDTLSGIASPLLHPLATIGIVVVFVIFILLQREDLRDRLIRLAGSHDLQRTTAAIDDAAKSLSKYFLTQAAVNTAFGIVVWLGLTIIGVPHPILWGALAGLLRFVPYVGALIAAALPVLVAAAVDPGWSLAIWPAGLILGLELLVGQVVEPMVYGHTSGISPLAVVISATLWTALWGPIGLLMATPLTICLVVLGRHVDHLEFLDVMLGNTPSLTPAQNFYQRLLARDPEEAAEQAENFMKDRPLASYYDEVALEGLELAQKDLTRGSLDRAKVLEIVTSVEALVDDLSDHVDAAEVADVPAETGNAISASGDDSQPRPRPGLLLAAEWQAERVVLCVGGRSALDDAASLLLAHLLQRQGLTARVAGYDTLSVAGIARLDPARIGLICLSYLDVSSLAHLRFAVRRLRRRVPEAKVLIGCWGQDPVAAEEMAISAKGDFHATSLRNAVEFCVGPSAEVDHDRVLDVPKVA